MATRGSEEQTGDRAGEVQALRAEVRRLRSELAESHRGAVVLDAELDQRARELERMDRHRNEFLAMLAHELRNPLAAIEMVAETLETAGDEKEAAEAKDILRRQLGNLGRMVDDLLDVSRVVRGKITIQKRRVDLREVVAGAVRSKEEAATAKTIDLLVQQPEDAVTVLGDPTRLEQVVVNLLDNALKHTPPGGRVTVSLMAGPTAEGRGSGARIHVADTGRGMSKEELDDVFMLFVQHRPDPHVTEGGLGLGLTLAHRLAALHDGTVRASSPGPGLGAVFEVELPLAARRSDAAAAPAPERSGGKAGATAPKPNSLEGRHLLVVDDNDDFRELLVRGLRRVGARVDEASRAADALELARERAGSIDALIADLGLPGMTGEELAEAFRQDATLAAVPLVAVTGYGGRTERARTKAAGFQAHLVKPIRVNDLVTTLDHLWDPS